MYIKIKYKKKDVLYITNLLNFGKPDSKILLNLPEIFYKNIKNKIKKRRHYCCANPFI